MQAQKEKTVSATFTYYAPETMTVDEAKRTALDRAKIQAIADEFGTLVSQSNSTIINNQNGESNIDFISIGGSDVKGEWIETIGTPQYDISFSSGNIIVKVSVKGVIREITSSTTVDFLAVPLRNGTELKYASTEFAKDDDFYLMFSSPVSGYLSVWLVDESTSNACCILPYQRCSMEAYKIEPNTNYLFFSSNFAKGEDVNIVDELVMTCEKPLELNELYMVFSPKSFSPPRMLKNDIRSLPTKKFHKWLADFRRGNNNASVITKTLTIKKNLDE